MGDDGWLRMKCPSILEFLSSIKDANYDVRWALPTPESGARGSASSESGIFKCHLVVDTVLYVPYYHTGIWAPGT